jgi:CRISPR system Cascade subunit CasB
MPDGLVGKGEEPSPGEWAAHAALTLYAIHQQSQTIPMHQRGREHGLGQAIRQLVQRNSDRYASLEQRASKEVCALVTAESFPRDDTLRASARQPTEERIHTT